MNSSFLSRSYMNSSNLNMSFNSTSNMSFSRRGGALMSTNLTQSLEPSGTPLPAMVRVALSSSQDPSAFSARIFPNGWACLVTGRKLFVWRHSQTQGQGGSSRSSAISCRELTLPPSELLHNAKLVTVLASSSSHPPACLAISPEGHITFWPSISNESSTVALNADIMGQEVDSLTSLWPLGAVATTTTSTVLFVKVIGFSQGQGQGGGRGNKPTLTALPLSAQKGWLGGLSKKMSTMLFNPIPQSSNTVDTKRARVLVPLGEEDDPNFPGDNELGKMYIFQGTTFQAWQVNQDGNPCSCIQEASIEDQLRKIFLQNVWSAEESSGHMDARMIQTWVLDVGYLPSSNRLAVLAAAKSEYEPTSNLIYGIMTFDVKHLRQKDVWSFFTLPSLTPGTLEEDHLYAFKLFVGNSHFYVISAEGIYSLPISGAGDASSYDTLDAAATLQGPIVGSGFGNFGSVLILTPKQGLLSLRPVILPSFGGDFAEESFLGDFRIPEHLQAALNTTAAVVHHGSSGEREDFVNRYKSVFLLFLQKKDTGDMVAELFPSRAPSLCPQDPVDIYTLAFAERLVDEAPVADPRWAVHSSLEGENLGKGKVLIKNFMLDKREGLELFFGFISSAGIFRRLQGIAVKDEVIATASLLYNTYEKIFFALSVHNMQNDPQLRKILDTGIRSIVIMRKEKDTMLKSSVLSHNDIFFKDVSKVHQLIPALVTILEEELSSLTSTDIPSRIVLTTEVILRSLCEVQGALETPGEKLGQIQEFLVKPLMEDNPNGFQVLPWIGEKAVLDSLNKLHEIIVQHAHLERDSSGQKLDLVKLLHQLTDLILDGLRTNLISVQNTARYPTKAERFESLRSALLKAHLSLKDYDGAGILGEKYLDFETLVTICYDRKDLGGLVDFFRKYESLSFPEFTFSWYVRQGKGAELVDTFATGSDYAERLRIFLKDFPNISWHHDTNLEDFSSASRTLRLLGAREEESADDKKFYLCLSKLASYADMGGDAAVSESVLEIDRHLGILEFQSRIPEEILNVYGLDRESARVLSPSEMIEMYTTSEVAFYPENYTNALGLVRYMINEDLQLEKKVLIAVRTILRDPWNQWETDHPVEVIAESALHSYLILALKQGWPLDEIYPQDLVFCFPDLKGLLESTNAKFLLTACYEHLSRNAQTFYSHDEEMME